MGYQTYEIKEQSIRNWGKKDYACKICCQVIVNTWFALKNNQYSSRLQRYFPDNVAKKNTWMKN